jgi:hypothetical protein
MSALGGTPRSSLIATVLSTALLVILVGLMMAGAI